MLMDLPDLVAKYDLKITGVLHVGAHLAEEAPIYAELGIRDVAWIEANPEVIGKIVSATKAYGHKVVCALVYSVDGVMLPFNVTNYDGMSSSIFEFGTHPEFSPDTVFVKTITLPTFTIDTIVAGYRIQANFLNMDLQGAELHALQGAERFLEGVDTIMTEVNKAEVYEGCARIEQLDEFLVGFRRVETHWVHGQGWGDALYVRRES